MNVKNRPFSRGGGGGLEQAMDDSIDDLANKADADNEESNSAGEAGKGNAAARENSVVGLPEFVELFGGVVVTGVAASEEDVGNVEIDCDDDVGEDGNETSGAENFHVGDKKLVHSKITPN